MILRYAPTETPSILNIDMNGTLVKDKYFENGQKRMLGAVACVYYPIFCKNKFRP